MKSRIIKCQDCGEKFDTEAGGLYRYQYPQLWTCPDCVKEEEIREITWNLCKQYDATQKRREKVHLRNLVTTELERRFGEEIENLYRSDWLEEVGLFCQKYGYAA